MINVYLNKKKHPKVFGCNIEDIEGYNEALSSSELYVVHHVLEWKYTATELMAMNRYWNVTPDELIFMPKSLHSSSKYIHKGKNNSLAALNLNRKGRKVGTKSSMWSNFGKLFYNHFKIHFYDNKSLYRRERIYWIRHGKCRWEA